VILASVVVLLAAAVALGIGAAMGDAGVWLVWAAAGGAIVSLVLLAVGIRRFRPGPR
jgi:O-antigen/teichoic acid export membrane protein